MIVLKGLSVAAIGLGVALSLAGSVQAAPQPKFELDLWASQPAAPDAYTPTDGSPACVAEWRAGIGLPDGGTPDESYALYLQKFASTFTDSGAGATVRGVKGIKLSEIGYDYKEGSHCGPGAPRFNVYVQGMGTYYFSLGCYYGNRHSTPTPDATGWTRVRFEDNDVWPSRADQSPWPGFGKVVVADMWIVFDEGLDQGTGYFTMDNITINGTVLNTKPTVAKKGNK
jgi:hypothetical protein